MNFIDQAEIEVKAGRGGNGLVSFRHEKYKPRGGPDGGDGGSGGSVCFEVVSDLNTLEPFRFMKHFEAKHGENGGKNRRHGKTAENLILRVPVGTIVWGKSDEFRVSSFELRKQTSEWVKIADLQKIGERFLAAEGGVGGFGNAHFTTSVRRAPRFGELGAPGEEKVLRLELKLLADVGLVGMPNAGKSSLLSVISAARPKIADYPFTTLAPNLGVVRIFGEEFVVADIPGLIEGASKGKGLGDEFLRHIERTRVLLILLDISHEDVAADYTILKEELAQFDVKLSKKPQILVFNKIDLIPPEESAGKFRELKKMFPRKKCFFISTVTKEGVKDLLQEVSKVLRKTPNTLNTLSESIDSKSRRPTSPTGEEVKVYTAEEYLKDSFEVIKEKGVFKVIGKKVERKALQTQWDNDEAVSHFLHIMHAMGVDRALRKAGAKSGSQVEIAGIRFEWKQEG